MATNKIEFARLGNKGYMAGIDLSKIISNASDIFPEIPKEKMIRIDEQSIPKMYNWSIRRVNEFRDWEANGTYLLIKNFETYESFKQYFPDAQIE